MLRTVHTMKWFKNHCTKNSMGDYEKSGFQIFDRYMFKYAGKTIEWNHSFVEIDGWIFREWMLKKSKPFK